MKITDYSGHVIAKNVSGRLIIELSDGTKFSVVEKRSHGAPALEVIGWSFPNQLLIRPQSGNVALLTNPKDELFERIEKDDE